MSGFSSSVGGSGSLVGFFSARFLASSSLIAATSTTPLPAFSALRAAAAMERVGTGLNTASTIKLVNSLPGSQTTLTAVMLEAVNFSALYAPLLWREILKAPKAPNLTFCPAKSCSRRQSTILVAIAATSARS